MVVCGDESSNRFNYEARISISFLLFAEDILDSLLVSSIVMMIVPAIRIGAILSHTAKLLCLVFEFSQITISSYHLLSNHSAVKRKQNNL